MTTLHVAPVLPDPAPELHKRIAQARRFQLRSQAALIRLMAEIDAEHTPTRRTLSSWENGRTSPTVDDLVLVARATRFPVAWFVVDLEGTYQPSPDGDTGDGVDLQGRTVPWRADSTLAGARHFGHLRRVA